MSQISNEMLAFLLLNRAGMNAKRRSQQEKLANVDEIENNFTETIYCRTCLSTEDLVSIFYDEDNIQKTTRDLKLVTGLEITMDDGLSQKICTHCIETMKMALQFRRTSKKTEKALLNMAGFKVESKKKLSTHFQNPLKPKVEDTKTVEVEIEQCNYDHEQFQEHDYYEVEIKEEVMTLPPTKKRKELDCTTYKCAICNKQYKTKGSYNSHMRFHTNFCVCETCGKKCRNNAVLQEHKRARHGLFKIHKCAYCDYSSATKDSLTIHERRHTGERPYTCDHCGATFHRRSNLVQHLAIHLPETNFQCDICHKWHKSKKRLQIHTHHVHRERQYRYMCPKCPKTYTAPDHVRQHLLKHHNIPRCEQGPIDKYIFNNN